MSGSFLLCSLLYAVAPSMFPGMDRVQGRKIEVLRLFVPLGVCFAVALYASNKAYLYCSIAFLQFMKESNVVLVFIMCCAVGLQKLDRVKAAIVVWVLGGSFMCVHGELSFSVVGFLLQATSQVAECSKNVLGEYIMSGTNFKLDPLTYTLFMAPCALVVLIAGCASTWEHNVIAAAYDNVYYIIPNVFCAFCLNVVIASVLKHCSSMGFILAGMLKDIVIVVVSSEIFGNLVTLPQYLGFAVTLAGCGAWTAVKLYPQGVLANHLCTLTGMTDESKTEQWPILADKK